MFDIIPIKGGLDNIDGFFCGGISAGLKTNNKNDLAFIRSDEPVLVSAVFTSNKFQAAPIRHFKKYGKTFKTNFVLVNAKNANAMTGDLGVEDIDTIFKSLSEKITLQNPIMSSTGVIGYRLNKEKIINAFSLFDFNTKDSNSAATAIMTTDSFKKEFCLKVEVDGEKPFHIAAICKGAGMINPAFATMLCFVLTDANVPEDKIYSLIKNASSSSFDAISVDGDTSTNDTLMLLSSAKSGVWHEEAFSVALGILTKHLALEVLRDGEGATKVVAFEVTNAASYEEAKTAAKALSNSLLVKTALFGEDPNWGRIASTIGASGVLCHESSLVVHYDDVLVFGNGQQELSKETETKANLVMKRDSYKISCNLGVGDKNFTAYGCDLGHEYVKINADYRS